MLDAAEVAALRPLGGSDSPHVDRTGVEFLTLDPASSTDLDQAFAIELAGSHSDADVILRYAIADVGWFVRHGDLIDREAWKRGVTVYMPHDRIGLYPPRLAEDAGSLLPGGPKPAVVFVVRIAPDGSVTLDGVERAMIRNRAKLAYSTVSPGDLPPAFPELARRFEIGERNRGADRIQMPEQEVVRRDDSAFQFAALAVANGAEYGMRQGDTRANRVARKLASADPAARAFCRLKLPLCLPCIGIPGDCAEKVAHKRSGCRQEIGSDWGKAADGAGIAQGKEFAFAADCNGCEAGKFSKLNDEWFARSRRGVVPPYSSRAEVTEDVPAEEVLDRRHRGKSRHR